MRATGCDVMLIGHAGHPEVEGTMGRFDTSFGGRIHLVADAKDVRTLEVRDPAKLAFVTQTTLSVDDTAEIVDGAARSASRCLRHRARRTSATPRRTARTPSRSCCAECDVLVVVGSRTSSNSNRLRELAERAGIPGYLVDGPEDLQARVVRGQARRRRHRRRLGAGDAGAAGPRAAARLGRAGAARGRRPRGAGDLRAAARAAAPGAGARPPTPPSLRRPPAQRA